AARERGIWIHANATMARMFVPDRTDCDDGASYAAQPASSSTLTWVKQGRYRHCANKRRGTCVPAREGSNRCHRGQRARDRAVDGRGEGAVVADDIPRTLRAQRLSPVAP